MKLVALSLFAFQVCCGTLLAQSKSGLEYYKELVASLKNNQALSQKVAVLNADNGEIKDTYAYSVHGDTYKLERNGITYFQKDSLLLEVNTLEKQVFIRYADASLFNPGKFVGDLSEHIASATFTEDGTIRTLTLKLHPYPGIAFNVSYHTEHLHLVRYEVVKEHPETPGDSNDPNAIAMVFEEIPSMIRQNETLATYITFSSITETYQLAKAYQDYEIITLL